MNKFSIQFFSPKKSHLKYGIASTNVIPEGYSFGKFLIFPNKLVRGVH